MKKRMVLLPAVALALVAGCAGNAGFRVADLRDSQYFRTERSVPQTFPKIQMALFKHQQACGHAPVFSLDPLQTGYATITQTPSPASSDASSEDARNTILVDLTRLEGGWFSEARTKMVVHSYYAGADTDKRIDQIFSAIAHPDVCPE